MAGIAHWDDETVSRIRRALANGITGPWLDDDSIRAVLDAADAVPAERLEGAVSLDDPRVLGTLARVIENRHGTLHGIGDTLREALAEIRREGER